MRFQFRIVHLFAAVTLAAVLIALSLAIYWQVVAPRTPIAWHSCEPGDLGRLRGGHMDVIVVASNATLTGSVHHVKITLDVPELRVLAHRGDIEFHICDITQEFHYPALRDMEAKLGIDDVFHPYIVILDGGRQPVEVVQFDGDRETAVSRILAAK